MLPGHVLCGYRVCGYGLCGRIFNGCTAPEQSMSVLCDMACAVQVQSRSYMCGIPLDRFIGIKKAGFLRLSVGVSWLPRLTFRLRFTAPRGLVFAVIVTAVPAVVSAGVAVPAAGCVGTVVLRVILLWFPDHVNDEPDDQNDRGDNPDPYAG